MLLEGWERDGGYPVTYVPTDLAPDDPRNAGWTGRTGRAEGDPRAGARRARTCDPSNTVAYICGNPDMIINVEEKLLRRGFAEEQRQEGALLAEGQDGTCRRHPGRQGGARRELIGASAGGARKQTSVTNCNGGRCYSR